MNSSGRNVIALSMVLAFFVASCGGRQPIPPAGGTGVDAVGTHIDKAVDYERAGALAAALREYRIAALLSPDVRSIRKKTVDLQAEIDRKAAESRKAAIDHRNRGRVRREREAWLTLLSYKPDDKTALNRLRAMEQIAEKRSLARKLKLSQKYYDDSQVTVAKNVIGYEREAFEYSRKALWEMQSRHVEIQVFLDEMQKHLRKYPGDEKIRSLFIDTCIKGADSEFVGKNYDKSLQYLSQGKEAAAGDSSWLARILQLNRQYAEELYAKGLRAYRDDKGRAADYWRLALRFDPQMGRARLRLRKINSTGSGLMER